jgi:arsenate reductase
MHDVTIYQKPSCSTCRKTMEMLRDQGVDFDAINYFIDPINKATLKDLLLKLKIPALGLFRTKEPAFKELKISERDHSEDELLDILAEHPELIERPIVVRGDSAVLGRPPENILTLF